MNKKQIPTITGDVLNKYVLVHDDHDGETTVCYTHKDYPLFEMTKHLDEHGIECKYMNIYKNSAGEIVFDYGNDISVFILRENMNV